MITKIKYFIITLFLIFNIFNNVNADGDCSFTTSEGFSIEIVGFCSDIGVYFTPTADSTLQDYLAFFEAAEKRNGGEDSETTFYTDDNGDGYKSGHCNGYIHYNGHDETSYTYSNWSKCINSYQSRTATKIITPKLLGTINNQTLQATTQSCDSTTPTGYVSYSITRWTNQNVVVTITCSDTGGSGCEMSAITGWNIIGNKYYRTFLKNAKGSIILKDKAGNSSSVSYSFSNIDKNKPKGNISYSPTGWTNQNVVVTIACSDTGGSGCKMGNISGWKKSGSKYSKSFSSNTSGNIILKDNAGNSKSVSFNVSNIDKIKPNGNVLNSPDGWTNQDVKVTIVCSDIGGSGCKMNYIEGWLVSLSNYYKTFSENTNGSIILKDKVGNSKSVYYSVSKIDKVKPECGNWTEESGWGQTRKMTLSNSTDDKSGMHDDSYECTVSEEKGQCSVNIYDNAGNSKTCISPKTERVDITPPTASDITITPANNTYLIANNSKNVHIVVNNNGGSPIKKIEYKYEKYDTNNLYSSLQIENDGEINKDFNFSNVDNDITTNGYRNYSFKIKKVCDEVGNCSSDLLYTYKVYANDIDLSNSSIIGTGGLSDGTKIADGSATQVKLILKDKYGNKIVPVKKDDGTNIRNVRVKVNYDNKLFLDQYKQSGTGAVFIGNTNLVGTETPDSGIFKNDSDGIYNLDFKVYSPTTNTYNKAKGSFKINNITAKVSDLGGAAKTFASGIEFKFSPIYKLTFENIGAKKYGFEEGIPQECKIENTKNGYSSTSDEKIYFEFGKFESGTGNVENNDFDLQLISSGETNMVKEGHQDNIEKLTEKKLSYISFKTKLNQQHTAVENYDLTYLASFVKYNIDGKTIAYPTDIIGKMTYSSGTGNNARTLEGIKVLGKTNGNNIQSIFGNQEKDINEVSGKIDKSFMKKIIRKNAYDIIKNLDIQYYTSTDNNYKKLGNVIFYKLNGGNIKYSAIQGDYKEKTGKTILIEGGNLIIEKNDLKSNFNGIHGIVVLKNRDGKGGEILVDEDVLNINAIMYADKAMFAYDSSKNDKNNDGYLDLDDDGILYFKNQLYIKGTLFSNNTIGGAIGANLKCAYYDTKNCNTKNAQKYDLNFIRRYYRYDSNYDGVIDTIANEGSGSLNIPPKYIDYPLVIEYNPLIQITPPPLFSK